MSALTGAPRSIVNSYQPNQSHRLLWNDKIRICHIRQMCRHLVIHADTKRKKEKKTMGILQRNSISKRGKNLTNNLYLCILKTKEK